MASGQHGVLKAIRDLYDTTDWARALFDHLAARRKNPSNSPIERWTRLLGVSLSEATSYAKQLEEAGCGRYIVGRRGGQSRFEWTYNAISVGQAASRQADDLIGADDEGMETETEEAVGNAQIAAPLTLTIAQAKEALARTFGVKPEQIEIIIKA